MKTTTFWNCVGLLIGAALLICAFPVFNGASLLGALIVYGILMSIHARRSLNKTAHQGHIPAGDLEFDTPENTGIEYGVIEEEAIHPGRAKSLLRRA